MILDVIKYGDRDFGKLKLKNVDVKKENPFLQKLISDMFETLDFYNKNGLSAPQVGHNLNFFVVKTKDLQEVFINPEIKIEGLQIQIKDSCLSFPNMEFAVDRYNIIKIKYFDKNWTYRIMEYKDNIANIIQHEYDHIKGKLIID